MMANKKTNDNHRLADRQTLLERIRKLREIDVYVPEWDQTIRLREITALEIDQFAREKNDKRFRAKFVIACAIDEHGEKLFAAEDEELLLNGSWQALLTLSNAAMTINESRESDLAEVEENFPPAPAAGSPTG
jgi:hypothetical protein